MSKTPKNQEREFDKLVTKFKRDLLRELLAQCTEFQVGIFNKMYVSIDDIPDKNMRWAYAQVTRTVEENRG